MADLDLLTLIKEMLSRESKPRLAQEITEAISEIKHLRQKVTQLEETISTLLDCTL